jgi:hypothetical protein
LVILANTIKEEIFMKLNRELTVKCLLAALIFSATLGISSAGVENFKSSVGTIEIDIPYAVELGDSSGGDSLQLIKPGTTKPIISINLWDSALYKQLYPTFLGFAESFVGLDHSFEEITTDDDKPMLFCAIQEGTDREGNPNYSFSGYIDDSEEHGKYVVIHAPNRVIYQGDVIATYTKEQFETICKSFAVK